MDFKDIIKQFGDVMSDGHSIVDRDKYIIPISPKLDLALGGGIQEGTLFTLTGLPKCGKTVTALTFAASAQQKEHGSREIFYGNVEGRIKKRDLEGIRGLDLNKLHIYGSTQDNILTASKYLEITERLIHEHPNSVIIVDSFSALVTEAEYTSGMDDMQRADAAKLISKFVRKITNVLPVNNVILVAITHLMANVTGYGKKYTEKSGNALAYQADTKLWANSFKRITDKNGMPIMQEVEWTVEFAANGCPGQKVQSVITFGIGIDKTLELVRLATDLNVIEKVGKWFKYKDKNANGEAQIYKYIVEEKMHDELYTEVKGIFA